jgi:hypothetical protein
MCELLQEEARQAFAQPRKSDKQSSGNSARQP